MFGLCTLSLQQQKAANRGGLCNLIKAENKKLSDLLFMTIAFSSLFPLVRLDFQSLTFLA
jgi:hypothetical protein